MTGTCLSTTTRHATVRDERLGIIINSSRNSSTGFAKTYSFAADVWSRRPLYLPLFAEFGVVGLKAEMD